MKLSGFIMFFASLTFSLTAAFGQNLYIEVLDANTYRVIPDVKVELESETSKMTFFTSANGSVGENVPSGVYVVTLSHLMYHTFVQPEVIVRAHEMTTLSLKMERTEDAPEQPTHTPERRDRTEVAEPADRRQREAETTTRTPATPIYRKGFIEVGYQFGEINAIHGSLALSLHKGFFLKLEYANSQQSYANMFFDSDQMYDIGFNNLLAGVGIHFESPTASGNSYFIRPGVLAGIEAFNNDNHIIHDDINFVLSYLVKPEIKAGLAFNNFGLFVGLNYTHWISGAMTQDGTGLYNLQTEKQIIWNDDLFLDRAGIGAVIGLNIFF